MKPGNYDDFGGVDHVKYCFEVPREFLNYFHIFFFMVNRITLALDMFGNISITLSYVHTTFLPAFHLDRVMFECI